VTAAARLKLDELLENVRRTLAPAEHAIRSHRYLDALAAGRVPESSLRAFAGEQFSIISSDRLSFAHLAGRFPEPPAGDFFLSLAAGEGEARSCLRGFAAEVGSPCVVTVSPPSVACLVDLASAIWARRGRRKEAEPLPAVRALHLPREFAGAPAQPLSHRG